MLILMAFNVKIPSKTVANTRENTASTLFDEVALAQNNLNKRIKINYLSLFILF